MTKNEKRGNTIGYYLLFISLGYSTAVSGRLLDRIPRGHLLLGFAQLTSAVLFVLVPRVGSLPVLLLIFVLMRLRRRKTLPVALAGE